MRHSTWEPDYHSENKELKAENESLKQKLKSINMGKKLYFVVESSYGDGATAELSGCMEWIKGDMEANFENSSRMPPDDQPQYTLTPKWLTDKEYEDLPEAD